MTTKCELCDELRGRPSRFSAIYSNVLDSRVVSVTENFSVLPSIGQLGDGHLMIVSRTHETALSRLSPIVQKEFSDLFVQVKRWMSYAIAPNIIAFENGDPLGNGQMSCSVSHLHVHVVASNQPLNNVRPAVTSLGGVALAEMEALASIAGPYSWVGFELDHAVVVPRRLPSQTLRQTIAAEVGTEKWDWRDVGVEPQLIKLVHGARAGLANLSGKAA